MPIKKSDLRATFLKKFKFEKLHGTRHGRLGLYVEGRLIVSTAFSSAWDDIDDGMLTQIAREIGVQLGYLKKMHRCSKNRDDYVECLKTSGWLN